MSYEIMYGKQFIKVNSGVVPLVLAGSNNCWDGNKRERKWGLFFDFFKDGIYKDTEIISLLENNLSNDLDWVSINNKSSKQGVINYYKNGVKKALTIEEIKERYWNYELKGNISYYDETIDPYWERYITIKKIDTFENSEDLEEFIKDYVSIRENRNEKVYLSLTFKYAHNDTLKLRPEYKVERERKEKERNYIIKCDTLKYFFKKVKNGFQYTWQKNYAKPFESEKEALKYIDNLVSKYNYTNYDFQVEKI